MALTFPTPVGGTSLSSDLAPSIVMAVLFGLLYPFIIYRTVKKNSRNILFINSIIMLVERPITYSIRAAQANNESLRLSSGMLKYMQLSYTLGYISMAQDLPKVLRAIVVNASLPEDFSQGAQSNDVQIQEDCSGTGLVHASQDNHPWIRFWVRRGTDFLNLAFLAAVVPGLVSGFSISGTIGNQDPSSGNRLMALRYASASVALFLTLILAVWMTYAMIKLPRIKREAGLVFITLCVLLSITPLYRLSVMHLRTTGTALSQSTQNADALNRPVDKALFYIFHILPEFIAPFIIFVRYNMRELCGFGFKGDVLMKDETPEEREERELKEAERRARGARMAQKFKSLFSV